MEPKRPVGEIPYEVLANALFENYESIYDIDLQTGAYNAYYESDPYRSLRLDRSGDDFFAALASGVERVVVPEDRSFVLRMLARDELMTGVRHAKYHSFVYRIMRDNRPVYHQLRATLAEIEGREHILMGIRDVDAVLRQNTARESALASQRQKAANYLGAVLATAAAYIDANLTTDCILEQSIDKSGKPGSRLAAPRSAKDMPSYSEFRAWVADRLVIEGRERYLRVSDRENLLKCFKAGEGRASVSFTIAREGQGPVPCREVFYLYREDATGDVHALSVIYDLTSQQRREKELEDLRHALDMSRIHNSASQMKPHFLYNALGSIQEVMLDDPARAASLLEDFTVHLRGCIKAMDGDRPIPFAQELENIRAYVNIEKMRLGDRLEMRYELGETAFDVLPLSIQPIVENAIRHGVHRAGPKGGSVTLRTWTDGGSWVVQVSDTGGGFDVAAYEEALARGETDSTGLKNIRLRLEKIMNASLEIASKLGAGTEVTVRIPKGGDAR